MHPVKTNHENSSMNTKLMIMIMTDQNESHDKNESIIFSPRRDCAGGRCVFRVSIRFLHPEILWMATIAGELVIIPNRITPLR